MRFLGCDLYFFTCKKSQNMLITRVDIDLEVHFAFAVDEGGLLVFAQGKPLVLHEAYTRLLRNHAAFNFQIVTTTFSLLAESVIPVTKCSSVSTITAAIVKTLENYGIERTLLTKNKHFVTMALKGKYYRMNNDSRLPDSDLLGRVHQIPVPPTAAKNIHP
jgi:hypothetical protein